MTRGAWLSPVRLVNSTLLGTTVHIATEYDGGTPIVTMSLSLQTEHLEKRGVMNVYRCVFGFNGVWHEPDNIDNVAFTITCSMGITVAIPDSAFESDFPAERINRVVDASAVSLVYGKVRCFIEDMTAQSSVGRQVIPAIDPYALLDSLEEKASTEGKTEPDLE